VRIDQLLVERGLAPSRAKAQALIMAGAVSSGGRRVDKVGTLVAQSADITVAGAGNRFVSRGGDKLDHALERFAEAGLEVRGAVCADIGASTGGFTDCLLSRGAAKVYAIDVGYGQLAFSLRQDARVVVRERTNAKNLAPGDFAEPIDLVVVDASFIGLGKLMAAISRIVRSGGALVALVKPQFEAGRLAASRGRGVIRDPDVRARAIESAKDAVASAGFSIRAEVDSALAGPKGNVERFLYAIYSRPGPSVGAGASPGAGASSPSPPSPT
jgi:23S rRNA (cytidine1920-2'-O)/16S rRNA (cytidine1409-2'-O)-methyltransferase